MRWLLHAVSVLLVLATAIPVLRGSDWWIRIFDFPRMQVAVAAGITLALYLLLFKAWTTLDMSIASLLAAAFFVQVYQIAPYTLIGRKEVFPCENASERIRLFNGNVFMENRNSAAYLELISEHEPDVVLLLETDDWWDEAVAGLAQQYEYAVRLPQSNTYGMILYSRLEIVDYEVRQLADDSVPSIFAILEMPSGNQITLVCLHPRPPRPDKQQD
ncbi:MAG: endonuclease/exonuclease/phosphatase family protein, partial [Rhodothermia bacterium]|nr:endonuclease/exonuclease/phosphatase family protein [Rhodothermia bacterium]